MQTIVKRKGHNEEFDEKKVYGSVYAACASTHYSEKNCERIAEKVLKKIKAFCKNKKEIKSEFIRQKIDSELKKINKELAFYYEQFLPNLNRL